MIPDCLQREMGCTLDDFLRWLPGATRDAAPERQGDTFLIRTGTARVAIRVEALPERRIAGIRLPVLSVTFDFRGLAQAERRTFLRHFDRHTQRGGG